MFTDISDHLPIFTILSDHCKNTSTNIYVTFRDKNANNMATFKAELQTVNWDDVTGHNDSNSAYETFLSKYIASYNNKCFPLKKVKARNGHLNKSWLSEGLLKSIKGKIFYISAISRGGEWYLEKRGSRKILAGSRNLGSVFDKSRSLVFAWFVFTFFESRNFLPKSLGFGFLTRILASRRVSDFTIRHPYLCNPSSDRENQYKKYRNKLISSLRAAKRIYYAKKLEECKSNMKST